MTLQFRHR